MPSFINLAGQTFSKLTVQSRAPNDGEKVCWICTCECGRTFTTTGSHLRTGHTKSCGCIADKGKRSTTREYGIWSKMLSRCYRKGNSNYRWYGGIGTRVCQRWRESVAAFIEDMGEAPSNLHTLDRINTLGHYTCGKCDECREKKQPANCRWATKAIQVRNAKNNRYFTHDGRTLILKDWAKLVGIKYTTLRNRIESGVPFSSAISAGHYDRKKINQSRHQ